MSADRPHPVFSLLLAAAASVSVTAARSAEATPDPAFLEYLGMWEASDEEWLLVSEGVERETEAADEEQESAEKVDEHANE